MPGRVLCLHHPEDLPELGSLAGADDDADAVPVDDERPLEPHVVHVVDLQPGGAFIYDVHRPQVFLPLINLW